MNTHKPLLLLFSYALFAISTNLLPSTITTAAAADVSDPVIDLSGKRLKTGVKYYILPVIRGRGGGVALTGSTSCPRRVIQAQFEVDNGLPLTFSPFDSPKDGIIRVSTDLNIKFSVSKGCARSNVWRLANVDESTGQSFLTTGGVQGNPGTQTISNWFKIQKNGDFYNLQFCPTVCNTCRVVCRDIGIFIDKNGMRNLALSDQPFLVMFKKA